MDDKEFDILLNFLKSGLSTRQLDRLLGINDKNGWISWRILKKYGIKKYDKSKLFFYSTRQSENIIRKLIKSHEKSSIDSLITKNPPANLEKYKNTFVIADSEKSFYKIMSGETRNIIKNFFNPKKKLIGKCQFINCKVNNSQIDTVHFLKDRPEIF
ncbi:MAG: hypothetical protein U9O53_06035, partial [archaeon]|nr:hypothetical protein [archaeon]